MAFSGKNLKYIRMRKDWTLDDLSNLSGVNKGYLSNLENGVQTNPGLKIVERLSRVFEMPLDYFSSQKQPKVDFPPDFPNGLKELLKKHERGTHPFDKKALKFLKGIVDRGPTNWSVQEWDALYKSYIQDQGKGKK